MKSKETLAAEEDILWQDRKRRMGMPLSFTKYIVDSDRLYIKKGFFSSETNELLLYRVLDIKSSRTLWQKIFGMGTIGLYSVDRSDRVIELKNIKNTDKVRKFLSNLIEERRNEMGVAGSELLGSASVPNGPKGKKPPEHECEECK